MTPGGWRIEHTTAEGLFLTYREKTPCSIDIQNIQYTDDHTLVAESVSELQSMLNTLESACMHTMGHDSQCHQDKDNDCRRG